MERSGAQTDPAGGIAGPFTPDDGPDTPDPMPPFYMPNPVVPRTEPAHPAAEPETAVAEAPAPAEATVERAPVITGEKAAPRGRRPGWTAMVIALLVVAVLVESVLLFRGNSGERARTEVLGVARRFLVLLTTYDATTLERQRAKVLALAAGDFRNTYSELTGDAFLAQLRERQATSAGNVVRLSVLGVNDDSATALGVVDITNTNKDLKTPRVERRLIELSMVKATSGWRIVDVDVMGTVVRI